MVSSYCLRKRRVCEHSALRLGLLNAYRWSAEQRPLEGLRLRSNYTNAWSSVWKGAFMNKIITDGIVFTPPKFAFGLYHWSSQGGTPGRDDYQNEPNVAFPTVQWPRADGRGGCSGWNHTIR